MTRLIKSLLTLTLLLLGFECMVYAFHLLNRPSDAAVYEGMVVLAVLFVSIPLVLWRLWRWHL